MLKNFISIFQYGDSCQPHQAVLVTGQPLSATPDSPPQSCRAVLVICTRQPSPAEPARPMPTVPGSLRQQQPSPTARGSPCQPLPAVPGSPSQPHCAALVSHTSSCASATPCVLIIKNIMRAGHHHRHAGNLSTASCEIFLCHVGHSTTT